MGNKPTMEKYRKMNISKHKFKSVFMSKTTTNKQQFSK